MNRFFPIPYPLHGLPGNPLPQNGQPIPIPANNEAVMAQNPRYPSEPYQGHEQSPYPQVPRVQSYPETPIVRQYPLEFREDFGRANITANGQGAELLRLKLPTIAQSLVVNARVVPNWESPEAQLSDPWAGVVDPTLPAALPNQIEAIAFLTWGHDGAISQVIFNLPMGQVARANVIGSEAKLIANLVPRYTPVIAIAAGPPAINGFLDADNTRRNNIFNFGNMNRLAVANLLNKSVMCMSWGGLGTIAQTSGNNDRSARPQRRFFGFLPAATLQGTVFRCPVAESGVAVSLVSDATAVNHDPAGGVAFAGTTLVFHQLLASGERILNYPANSIQFLRADCVAIEVVPVANTPARIAPFELVYDLGF